MGAGSSPPPADEPSATGTLVYLCVGPLVWSAHLLTVYGAHALLCETDADPALPALFIIVTTVAAAAALALGWMLRTPLAALLSVARAASGRATYDAVFGVLVLLSLVAVIWAGVAALLIDACVATR
jgi:hypothetical protein